MARTSRPPRVSDREYSRGASPAGAESLQTPPRSTAPVIVEPSGEARRITEPGVAVPDRDVAPAWRTAVVSWGGAR